MERNNKKTKRMAGAKQKKSEKSGEKQKVVVAMSGGVDSSVAAVLLKKRGFDVCGVFMKFWAEPAKNKTSLVGTWNKCCSPESEKRAKKIANMLNIPFFVLDFRKEFKRKVVDYFLEEHKKGRTPNPCVVCNKEIKFGLLLKKARALRADFIATGHYARKKIDVSGYCKLLKSKDENKDQSYFLWQISQKELKRVLFPIGDFRKEEIKKMAKQFKLPFSNVSESMEICFIRTTLFDFLSGRLKETTGKIINQNGKFLGWHKGLWHYTIGQRKGIGFSGGPYWVLKKDIKRNVLIVSEKETDLRCKKLICEKVNWISGFPPIFPVKIKAKIRYRSQSISAIVRAIKTKRKQNRDYSLYSVKFSKSQLAATPGQSIVFYKGKELLGGGVIAKTFREIY